METTRHSHFDVIVIGGGPSGASAARTLAERGISVALIEKNFSFEKPCGGGLFLPAFDEFDLPKTLITRQADTIVLVAPSGRRVAVDIAHHPIGIVHRQVFDRTLRQLAEEAGAHLIEAKAHHIRRMEEGIEVHLRRRNGEEMHLIGDYLIAADGVTSTTRLLLRGDHPGRVLTHYADIPAQETDACEFWFGRDISPGYYSWIFPHYEGVNIGFVADSPKQMRTFYERFLAKAAIADRPKPKGYFIPEWDRRSPLYEDRVFYVGDAASLVLPFTYEGIYYALQSGRLAAEAIVNKSPESYEKIWHERYGKKFRFLRRLQRIFLSSDRLSEKMVSLYENPRFQQAVLGYWMGTRKPSGFFGTMIKVLKAIFIFR